MIIGLTIVAVGTSLPELAATVGAAMKGQPDIAIGNIVGSNILNILAVLAVPASSVPRTGLFSGLARQRHDAGAYLDAGIICLRLKLRAVITRFEGMVMLLAWIGYNALLAQQA